MSDADQLRKLLETCGLQDLMKLADPSAINELEGMISELGGVNGPRRRVCT